VLIDRENKTALVIDIAVPLIYILPKTEAVKITKYEKLALELKKNIWKLNNLSVHLLVVSAEGMVIKSVLKYIENIGLTKNGLILAQNSGM